jgi:hypothetical protein
LAGDARLFTALMNECRYKDPVCAGALCFAEDFRDRRKIDGIIDTFERKVLFPGLDPARFCRVWTLHCEPGDRVALHFHVLKQDLVTEKHYNPYFHNKDMPRKEAWQNWVNAAYGLSSPKDPDRRRLIDNNNRLPQTVGEFKNELTAMLVERIQDGSLRDWEDVKYAVEYAGCEIVRQGKYLTIHHTNYDKNIRLKGKIYNEHECNEYITSAGSVDISAGAESRSVEQKIELRSGASGHDLDTLRGILQEYVEKAAARNRDRYSSGGSDGIEEVSAIDAGHGNPLLPGNLDGDVLRQRLATGAGEAREPSGYSNISGGKEIGPGGYETPPSGGSGLEPRPGSSEKQRHNHFPRGSLRTGFGEASHRLHPANLSWGEWDSVGKNRKKVVTEKKDQDRGNNKKCTVGMAEIFQRAIRLYEEQISRCRNLAKRINRAVDKLRAIGVPEPIPEADYKRHVSAIRGFVGKLERNARYIKSEHSHAGSGVKPTSIKNTSARESVDKRPIRIGGDSNTNEATGIGI